MCGCRLSKCLTMTAAVPVTFQVVRSGSKFDSTAVSPVVRQTLLHWGYELTEHDYKQGAKRVKT